MPWAEHSQPPEKENAMDINPVADCWCGHPGRLHSESGVCSMGDCRRFKEVVSEVETMGRCTVCSRFHNTGRCPYNHHEG
jgi:hypothetical protein